MELLKSKTWGTLIATGLSLPVTLGLFLLMAKLISEPAELKRSSDSENFIDFIRSIPNTQSQARRRSLPKKPPTPKAAPNMPKMAVKAQSQAKAPSMNSMLPMLNSPLALGDGPYLGGGVGAGSGQGDNDAIPLVRIEPQYPRKAAMQGKEGWVQLKFDVTAAGTVNNVEIMKSRPNRIFNQAAKKALLKWKYRPKVVDGKAKARKGLMVQLDFKLRN